MIILVGHTIMVENIEDINEKIFWELMRNWYLRVLFYWSINFYNEETDSFFLWEFSLVRTIFTKKYKKKFLIIFF